MRLNLSGVKRVVEDLMGDECIIVRDVERTGDDTWDSTTGTYTPPAEDEITIYRGKCSVSGQQGSPQLLGGQYQMTGIYWLSIPVDTDPLLPLDKVMITESDRDPRLVDKIFIIDDMIFGTYSVSRRVRMHLYTVVPHGE